MDNNYTPQELSEYRSSLMAFNDYYNTLETAKQEGRKEGEKKKTLELAKKMKEQNLNIETIISITNLTAEEIKNL